MKRSDFLKRLGIGLGVAIVAPQVLADMPAKEEILKPIEFKPKKLSTNITPKEWMDYYKRTGELMYDHNWYSRTFPSYIDRETGRTVYVTRFETERLYGMEKNIKDSINL